jgi:hypothetical protein
MHDDLSDARKSWVSAGPIAASKYKLEGQETTR